MTTLLTKEQRRDALANDAARLEAAMERRLADPLIRQIVCRPARGQTQSAYTLSPRKTACG